MLATSIWRRRSLRVITVALAIPITGLMPGHVYAQAVPDVPSKDYLALVQPPQPEFLNGFGQLYKQLGSDIMGDPIEVEHPTDDADAVQLTTTGLAVWHKGKLPEFTDGWKTYTLAVAAAVKSSAPVVAVSQSVSGIWSQLGQCEASGNARANTGNGYYGLFQEDLKFWANYGNPAYARPDLAPVSEQLAAAQKGQKAQGWGAWPSCSVRLKLR